jgi:hypothetical protein
MIPIPELPAVTKRFFDEHEQYNEAGLTAADRFEKLLWPLMIEYAEQGYSLRELTCIVVSEFTADVSLLSLTHQRQRKHGKRPTNPQDLQTPGSD